MKRLIRTGQQVGLSRVSISSAEPKQLEPLAKRLKGSAFTVTWTRTKYRTPRPDSDLGVCRVEGFGF